jgi:hypothetical protein
MSAGLVLLMYFSFEATFTAFVCIDSITEEVHMRMPT